MIPEDSIQLLNGINCNFGFNQKTIELVNSYIQKLIQWNKKINLVGHKSLNELIGNSIFDCFLVAEYFLNNQLFKHQKAMDFGTGAGLPGVILKIINDCELPSCDFECHLVESKQKKSIFLNHINLELNLDLHLHFNRLEKINQKDYDWIITRATLPSNQQIVGLLKKHLKKNGEIYIMKSKPEKDDLKVQWIKNIELSKINQNKRYLIHIIP